MYGDFLTCFGIVRLLDFSLLGFEFFEINTEFFDCRLALIERSLPGFAFFAFASTVSIPFYSFDFNFNLFLFSSRGLEIYSVLANGSGRQLIVSKSNSVDRYSFLPAWSPDGEQIVFGASGDVFRTAADGSTGVAAVTNIGELSLRRLHWRQ